MIKLLIRKFIPNYEDVENNEVREAYGVMAGILGIICNLILVVTKLLIGAAMNSIAIISDGFNNLSDTGSSLVSLIGAKMSSKKPDSDHPFGHGRLEYISALIVSFIIMFVGIETLVSSTKKIFNPSHVKFSTILIVILALSCFIKLWMFFYNRYMSRKINSEMLKAAATDSLNDVFATSSVIIATVIGRFTGYFSIDGVLGLVVSFLILKSGYSIAKDTITMLLGRPPEPELVQKIQDIILSEDEIIGIHDLLVHDYGPGRTVASAHAEVSDDSDITHIHEIIDKLEKRITDELRIMMVIHMDPIAIHCPQTTALREMTARLAKQIDERITIHDFRITNGEENINLIFDMVLPIDLSDEKDKQIADKLTELIKEENERCNTVINIDVI